jgi:hypothetical protein
MKDSDLSLSLELVYLINWLLKNDVSTLNNIILNAIKNGLAKDLEEIEHKDLENLPNDLYYSFFKFIRLLEDLLQNNLENLYLEEKSEGNLQRIVRKIKASNFDDQTLQSGLHDTKLELAKIDKRVAIKRSILNQETNEILFTKLLKNWIPEKTDLCN